MTKPERTELSNLSAQVANLRYRAIRNRMDNPVFEIWSSRTSPTCGRRPSAMGCRETKKAMGAPKRPQDGAKELVVRPLAAT